MTDFRNNSLAQGSRGLRNNDPGNLKQGTIPWSGEVGTDGVDDTFDTVEDGIRAMAITLCNYQLLHGLYTLNDIFNRWAPASDGNDPTQYAQYVGDYIGVDPAAQFTITADNIIPLMQAIVNMELGSYSQYITPQMLSDGANSLSAKILEFLGTPTGKVSIIAIVVAIAALIYFTTKRR